MVTVVPELPGVLPRDEAFERLYRRHVKDVYHYSLALLRNPADAEDVTQTTFLNAYRAFRRGEQVEKPQNWLIKIAHNVARSRYSRQARRVKEVPLEDHAEQLSAPEDDRPDVESVLRALGGLPFNQRAAIVMRELEGRSYAEIADTIGVSVSAVETLIFRARRSLRVRAAALKSIGAVPLPSSLTQLFGGGGAVAGGIGAGFAAKALVAVVVGALATGVGGDRSTSADAAKVAADPAVAAAQTPGMPGGSLQVVKAGQTAAGGAGTPILPALRETGGDERLNRPESILAPPLVFGDSPGATAAPSPALVGAPLPIPAAPGTSTVTSAVTGTATSATDAVKDTVDSTVSTVDQTVSSVTGALPVQIPTVPQLPIQPPSPPALP